MIWFRRKTNEGSNPSQSVSMAKETEALEQLRRYLDENGVEWHREFDKDAIVFTMPSGAEVFISGMVFVTFKSQRDIVYFILNQLDKFAES